MGCCALGSKEGVLGKHQWGQPYNAGGIGYHGGGVYGNWGTEEVENAEGSAVAEEQTAEGTAEVGRSEVIAGSWGMRRRLTHHPFDHS